MLRYILRRLLLMIPTLFGISIIAFIIIQLPPGDYLTTVIAQLSAAGDLVEEDVIAGLKARTDWTGPCTCST